MSTRDSISAMPGGPDLVALLDQVTGCDPAAIRAIATRWRGAGGKVLSHAGTLGSAVTTVDLAWHGDSADAFVRYMADYGKAGSDLNSALSSCATALDDAAGTLERAKGQVDGICDRLVTSVNAFRNANPDAEQKEIDDHARPLVTSARTRAATHVSGAKQAVKEATTAIETALGERNKTFAKIKAPGDQDFVPAADHKIDWQRTMSYTTQSASGGGGGIPLGGTFGGYGPSGMPPAGGRHVPEGQVKKWIEQAIAILMEHGYPADKMNVSDIYTIIQHESGGNPNAINLWDSNAAAGHPSKGLMQTIDPTFNTWALDDEHKNIYDPVHNIIAGVRYAIDRYGSVSAVPGVIASKTPGASYVGY
ncbi:transglycosylase SLT domain-containing protein [Nonomuraea sp. LPB2021202275-12-8]|uniref:transglycosylase SLT domain-containing protein n=1 Tax=Nonomuraea sp. LPB2021202275-12-8 TaxID=3120159 RepID=UPI00300CC8AF